MSDDSPPSSDPPEDSPSDDSGVGADPSGEPPSSEPPGEGPPDDAPPADPPGGPEPSESFLSANPPGAALREAWAEHRLHVYFATALFAIGIVAGAALGAAGYDLLAMIEEALGEHPFEGIEDEELTAWFFIANNSVPYFLSIVGAATVGILTAYIMVFNGIIVGNVSWFVGGEMGVDFILVGLLPHGIFELPALFIAAGVGFRLLHRLGQRVLGRRESFVTKPYLYRTALLVVFGWLLLVIAAFVEAYVTGVILEALFADRLDEQAAAANETAAAVVALVGGT